MRHLPMVLSAVFVFSFSVASADQNDPELDRLFARLQETDSGYAAAEITNRIWRLWHEYDDEVISRLMSQGIHSMQHSRLDEAIALFTEVVELAPDFAEGWNVRATAYYLMGEYALSTEDVKQTLKLEPRHFGALSGQGLIYLRLNKLSAALEYMEEALKYNPHMDNLRENIEIIKRQIKKEVI